MICRHFGEVVQRDLCRPCFRSRKCQRCGDVNRVADAPLCWRCLERRRALGSEQGRLVVWCTICFSDADRNSMLCLVCLRSGPPRLCHHCGADEAVIDEIFRCTTLQCHAQLRFCNKCAVLVQDLATIQCKTCWHANGDLCVACKAQPA